MKSSRFILTLLAAAICLPAVDALADGEGTRDREKIIDVQSLTEAMQKATEPVAHRMKTSKLKERFAEVKTLLEAKEVDKEKLLESLKALKAEMDSFTDDWETVVKPLWDGQEALAKTIDKVRAVMASGEGGAQSAKTKALLENYDTRLQSLARAIQTETDPKRKERLRTIFANVLSLRKLVESVGRVNLGPATEALQIKIVQALSGLQDQLTMATFEVEKVRVILVSESEFVGNYVDILDGMVSAEKLAKALGDMKTAGTGVGALTLDVGELKTQAEDFASMMNGFASKLADSIETETAKVAERVEDSPELKNVDIDAEIRRYAEQQQPKTASRR